MGFVILAVVAVAAFVAGLLVGRRNPSVANVAASVANSAQTVAQDVAKKV